MEEILKNTFSLCDECITKVPASIIKKNNQIFIKKFCPEHGTKEILLSTDIDYYIQEDQVKLANFKFKKNRAKNGCPFDCGICENHAQHAAMAIIEVTDSCNMKCSTCIAASYPGASVHKDVSTIEKMMDAVIIQEGEPGVIMISGGEPTIHPKFFEILDCAISKKFRRIMIITNGLVLANDLDFVKKLSNYKDYIEIYLQFDSLRSETLIDIRGTDLSSIRKTAVKNLEKFELYSTLICVVKKDNLNELGEVVDFALQHQHIVGITFQPIKITGRHDSYLTDNMVTTSEVIDKLCNINFITKRNFVPHPLNPHGISISYFNRKQDLKSVSSQIFNSKTKLENVNKRIYYTPDMSDENFSYSDLFRLTVVNFLDKFNFDFNLVRSCCIHFVTEDLKIIPFDTYYMFHKNLTKII